METRTGAKGGMGGTTTPTPGRVELRYAILYNFRRGLTYQQCFEEMKLVYGDDGPSLECVREWFLKFRSGRFSVEQAPGGGRPRTSTDDENIAAVQKLIDEDARVTYAVVEQRLGLSAKAVHTIIHEHLNLSKKSARWVPRILTPDHKRRRVDFCRQFLTAFRNGESSNMKMILTGDETWLYNHDPETKQQSMEWSSVGAAPPTKALRARSAGKVMVACFFTMDGFFHYVPVEDGRTVTAQWYTTVCLPIVFQELLKGRPQAALRRWFLHHDNAPAHRAETTISFLANAGIQLIEPSPYSPDLAPCDFWLFPTVKRELRGKRFQTREELFAAFEAEVAKLKKEDFHLCFNQWIYRMKKCVELDGDYVEK